MTSRDVAPVAPIGSLIKERDPVSEANILLGMNILRHLHIYIAYQEHKLYITPAGKPAATGEAAKGN